MKTRSDVVIVAAMEEEAAPFLTNQPSEKLDFPVGDAWRVEVAGHDVVLIRSGVGLTNAAVAATAAITMFNPLVLVSVGTAGGLAEGIYVGDVVVGLSYAYTNADASAFGYVAGQIPGMPARYFGSEDMVTAATKAPITEYRVRPGRVISGNSFVDATLVDSTREKFPGALAVDMESTALAQVAYLYKLPFVSVRAISDLCGPSAGSDFRMSIDEVAERSADVTRHVVAQLPRRD